jgi:hypothetical protein
VQQCSTIHQSSSHGLDFHPVKTADVADIKGNAFGQSSTSMSNSLNSAADVGDNYSTASGCSSHRDSIGQEERPSADQISKAGASLNQETERQSPELKTMELNKLTN